MSEAHEGNLGGNFRLLKCKRLLKLKTKQQNIYTELSLLIIKGRKPMTRRKVTE